MEQKYRTTLEEASRTAQSRRLEAIKEYEAFIKRHPNDKIWTPDVLMRLAELYYEKSEVDYRYADKEYNRRLLEVERISRLAKRELPMPSIFHGRVRGPSSYSEPWLEWPSWSSASSAARSSSWPWSGAARARETTRGARARALRMGEDRGDPKRG